MIAVAPAGVFVIDATHHKGLVHTKRPGPIGQLGPSRAPRGPHRNCTPLLDALRQQAAVVRATLDGSPRATEVPVGAMLCLTRAEWGLASSARVRDVWVGWPRLMAAALRSPGIIDPPTVVDVAGALEAHLPAG